MKITIEISSKEIGEYIRAAVANESYEHQCKVEDATEKLGGVDQTKNSAKRKEALRHMYTNRIEREKAISDELFEIGRQIHGQIKEL